GDDDCEGTNSIVTMPMVADVGYFIRVAGYDHETGDYTLTVNQHPPVLPDVPSQPTPADGSGVRSAPTVLSWNGTAPAANALNKKRPPLKSSDGHASQPKTIYGRDDRVEEYQVTNPNVLAVGEATAMILYRQDLIDNGDGTYDVQAPSFAWWYEWLDPLETGNALCDDEPFREQPTAGVCSAILVGANLVATAGHCVACLHPDDIAVVFDFVMQNANTATTTLSADQVYWPTEIVAYQTGHPDWGLVRLDREVVERRPLTLRRTKQVADDQRLLIVGHPWGAPRKYDAGGVVTENAEPAFFQANVDSYKGSSGSPVVNLDTWVVEGLLVRGMDDFVEDETLGCDRSLVCPDTGCPDEERFEWQDVTRATTFSAAVPSFDVYLGTDPDHLELAGAGLVIPRYELGPLRKDTVYYWRVFARNAHGQAEGPLWSFRTAASPIVGQADEEIF
ncbi:MAG: trypsin-like serine peptidase, partial [Planctomycetota bacterium]